MTTTLPRSVSRSRGRWPWHHKEFPASWMIWEDTPLLKISERLETIGIRSAVFDPCAGTPASGDFPSVMEENLQALRRVFAAQSL